MLRIFVRHFAAPAKAAGGKAAKGGAKKKVAKPSKLGNTLTSGPTGLATGEPLPISILKDGKDPIIKPDSEYPDWLWKVHKLPTLEDCQKILAEYQQGNFDPPLDIYLRFQKLQKKKKLKDNNKQSLIL